MIRFSTARPWTGRLALASALLLAFACNNRRPPPQSGRFDRPNHVAFACVVDEQLRRLSDCAVDDADHDERMYALVTQSARGEVAAVDLNYDRGRGRILDARRDIPGFTFTPVGELPSGIQVAANHPGVTYVANFASRDVYVVDTTALLSLSDMDAPVRQIVSLDVGTAGDAGVPSDAGAVQRRGAGPVAMRLTPDEDALVLALPDQGQVVWLPIERCGNSSPASCTDGRLLAAEMRFIDLQASSNLLATTVEAAVEDDPYELTCSLERGTPAASDPVELPPEEIERAPRPVALAFDAFCGDEDPCTRQVVIADESLPVLHRLDLDALGDPAGDPILSPITVGVPTLDVAITPNVPSSLGSDEAVKYIYAIDAGDGSVLVIRDGSVLDVSSDPDKPSNRLPLERRPGRGMAVAKRLEILTPVFDPAGPAEQYVVETRKKTSDPGRNELDDLACLDADHDEIDLDRLRGVFLAVATSDGHVHVVDVHDMELPHGSGGCLERRCSFEPDLPRVIRHHPRLSQRLLDQTEPTLTPEKETLFFLVDGVAFSVRDDGSTGTANAPGLDCMTCDEALAQVVPDPNEVFAADPEPEEPEPMQMDAGADAGVDGGLGGEPEPGEPDDVVDGGLGGEPEPGEPDDVVDGGLGGEPEPGEADDVVDAGSRMEQGTRVCPEETPAVVCSRVDPWLDLNQLWRAQYEGLLAGSQGGHGHLDGDAPTTFEGEVDFCLAGVLGDRDMPEVTKSSGETLRPVGDQLVITSPVLDETLLGMLYPGVDDEELEACAELAEALDDEDAPRIAFPIKRAFRDRLEIDLQLIESVGGASSYADIALCMGAQPTPGEGGLPLRFHVRLREAYRVIGSEDGYANNVISDESDGHCRVDLDADPLANGRAFPGVRFTNRLIQFQPHEPGPDEREPAADVELRLRVVTRARRMSADLTTTGFSTFAVIPEDLFYNPVDQRLYLVDVNSRGLVPIQLDPFPEIVGVTFN